MEKKNRVSEQNIKRQGTSTSIEFIAPARSSVQKKATSARGRKRSAWKLDVHNYMLEEFGRLKGSGVKVTRPMLQEIGMEFLNAYEKGNIANGYGDEIVNRYFMQDFCARHNLVVRMQSGTRFRNLLWEDYYDRRIAAYLGEVRNLFLEGLDENLVFNLDETHLIMDADEGQAVGVLGEKSVN